MQIKKIRDLSHMDMYMYDSRTLCVRDTTWLWQRDSDDTHRDDDAHSDDDARVVVDAVSIDDVPLDATRAAQLPIGLKHLRVLCGLADDDIDLRPYLHLECVVIETSAYAGPAPRFPSDDSVSFTSLACARSLRLPPGMRFLYVCPRVQHTIEWPTRDTVIEHLHGSAHFIAEALATLHVPNLHRIQTLPNFNAHDMHHMHRVLLSGKRAPDVAKRFIQSHVTVFDTDALLRWSIYDLRRVRVLTIGTCAEVLPDMPCLEEIHITHLCSPELYVPPSVHTLVLRFLCRALNVPRHFARLPASLRVLQLRCSVDVAESLPDHLHELHVYCTDTGGVVISRVPAQLRKLVVRNASINVRTVLPSLHTLVTDGPVHARNVTGFNCVLTHLTCRYIDTDTPNQLDFLKSVQKLCVYASLPLHDMHLRVCNVRDLTLPHGFSASLDAIAAAPLTRLEIGHGFTCKLDTLPHTLRRLRLGHNTHAHIAHLPNTITKLACECGQKLGGNLPSNVCRITIRCNHISYGECPGTDAGACARIHTVTLRSTCHVWVSAGRAFGVDSRSFGVDSRSFGVDSRSFGVDSRSFGVLPPNTQTLILKRLHPHARVHAPASLTELGIDSEYDTACVSLDDAACVRVYLNPRESSGTYL